MSEPPLVPAPLYGLRTWRVVGEAGSERLAGPHQGDTWPPAGEWLEATCSTTPEHAPPSRDCDCGIHAWHPSPRSARRVLTRRSDVAGIAEARGSVELHLDGFRAERARPYALLLTPRANAPLVRRLAEAYGAELVEARDATAVLAFCRSRGLGFDEPTLARLMGPQALEGWRRTKRAGARRSMLRLAGAVAVTALLVLAGLQLTDPPGDRALSGRTGEVKPQSR